MILGEKILRHRKNPFPKSAQGLSGVILVGRSPETTLYPFPLKADLGKYFNEDRIRTLRYSFYVGRYLRKRKVNSG